MIKTWTLGNFKSVYDKTTLDIAPLTIFCGANSSGKSTLIQSILLTAQTLQSPVYSRAVILNGHIVRLGTFNDIVSNEHDDGSILIGFALSPVSKEQDYTMPPLSSGFYMRSSNMLKRLNSVNCSFTFSTNGSKENKEVLQLQPNLDECYIGIKHRFEKNSGDEEINIRRSDKSIEERVTHYKLSDKYLQIADTSSLEYEVIKPKRMDGARRYYRHRTAGQPVGVGLSHFLPQSISIIYDDVEERAKRVVELFVSPDELRYRDSDIAFEEALPEAFEKSLLDMIISLRDDNIFVESLSDTVKNRFLNACKKLEQEFSPINYRNCFIPLPVSQKRSIIQLLGEKQDELTNILKSGRLPEYNMAYVPLSEVSEFSVSYIQRFFTRMVKYLGPLRDEPKPVYPLSGATDTKDIGFKGEHTAAVLDIYRDEIISYIPCSEFTKNATSPEVKNVRLFDAVLDWLDYMGVACNVDTVDKGKLGHELKITTSGASFLHDLTHVGVGVSQVLPILVLSLLAEPGSTLIFEQPELHLHPRVQTRLADFFISMTILNKQCIVETHSEYLINRIRYRAVVSDEHEISDNVIIYFAEKNNGQSAYKPIKINKYGGIDGWPKGFFDENEENSRAILKEAMSKRKRDKKNEAENIF